MITIAFNALRRYLRSRSNLFFVLVLPVLIIFLVGYSAGTLGDVPLAVVGGQNPSAQEVLARIDPDNIVYLDSEEEAIRAVSQNDTSAMVLFPDDLAMPIGFRSQADRGLNHLAQLRLAIDEENLGRLQSAVGGPTPARTVVETQTSGEEVWKGLTNLEASAMTQAVLFTFLAAMTSASFLSEDRQLGMLTRKAAAPISSAGLAAGETLGRFFVSAFQASFIVIMSMVMLGVGWGNPLATLTVLVVFSFVSTAFAVLSGSLFDNPEAAVGVGIMLSLVLAALGGAMAPVEVFPEAMQQIARFTPHYWAISGLKSSMTGSPGDIYGALGVLVLFATVGLALSTLTMRYRSLAR